MTPKMTYNNTPKPNPGVNARRSLVSAPRRLVRMLLAGIFLLVMGQRVSAEGPSYLGPNPLPPTTEDYDYIIGGYKVHVHVDNNQIADGVSNDVITVTVTDAVTGLPVNGVTLSFKIENTSLVDNEKTGDPTNGFPAGVVQYEQASNLTGATNIVMTLKDLLGNTSNFPNPIALSFIPGPPVSSTPPGVSGTVFTIRTDNAVGEATRSNQNSVNAYVTDKNGNPVGGVPVYFTITGNGTAGATADFTNGTHTIVGFTDASGNVSIPLTDSKPGTVEVSASLTNGGPGINGSTRTVTFVAMPVDAAHSYVVVTQDYQTADGNAVDIVTAYLFDKNGQPTSGSITFTTPFGGSATLATTSSSGNTATAQYQDFNIEGVQVVATDAAGEALPDQSNPANNYVTIHFVAGPPDAAHSYFVVTQDGAAADGKAHDIVTAYLFDAQGRPTTGTVNFAPTGGATQDGPAVASGNTVAASFTDINVEGVPVTGTTGNGVVLHDGSPAGNAFVTVNFVAGPPDAAKSYFIVTQDGALANGQAQDIVTAYLFDAQGHPTTGNVNFVVGGGATLKVKTVVGNVVTAAFIDNNVESPQVTGTTDNGVVLHDGNAPANNYVTIHFVVGTAVPGDPAGGGTGGTPPGNGGNPPGGNNGGGTGGPGSNPGGGNGNNSGPGDDNGFTHLFVNQDYRLGDGKGQDSVIAYITDAYKHPIKGEHIQFIIQLLPTSGTATTTAAFTISPLDVVTDDQGMARIALTSTKPGTVFVNAILLSQNVLIDGSYQVVTFTDKPDVNNPRTRLDVVIYEALADGSQQTAVKAHVVAMSGDDMAGVYVKFKIDSGSADFVGPDSVMTDANGDAIIYLTSKTPGKVKVTASVQGLEIINNSPVYVKFAMINIYVPKVFTPNNDGTNDLLKPILVGIQTFRYFSVYNRWGNLIFTTEDPNRGWDGTFKGVAQPVETYLWMAEGVDVEGKRIVAKGMTSLVR